MYVEGIVRTWGIVPIRIGHYYCHLSLRIFALLTCSSFTINNHFALCPLYVVFLFPTRVPAPWPLLFPGRGLAFDVASWQGGRGLGGSSPLLLHWTPGLVLGTMLGISPSCQRHSGTLSDAPCHCACAGSRACDVTGVHHSITTGVMSVWMAAMPPAMA